MLTLKYPTVYSVEDKKGEKYLVGFPLSYLYDSTDYKHIKYGSFNGVFFNGLSFLLCAYAQCRCQWFYANNTFGIYMEFPEIAFPNGMISGSQTNTVYLSVNGSSEIETIGICDTLFYNNQPRLSSAFVFENVELKDSDKITVRFENAFTLGYFVTYEYSRDSDLILLHKPMSYQASVIPWQDNVGVKQIGDYYIKQKGD